MARTVTYDLYGMIGYGTSAKLAKQDAEQKLRAAVQETQEQDYRPHCLTWRNSTILVTRAPGHWESRLIRYQGMDEASATHSCAMFVSSLPEVLNTAKQHLAQLEWRVEDGIEIPEILKDAPPSAQIGFEGWVHFQMRYRELREAGHNDTDAHRLAFG